MANDERDLLYKLQRGDYEAFERLYDRYSLRLTAAIFRLVKSQELTADILQDLFLKVWNHRAALDPDKSFRSFLFRIAENLVFDFYRKASRDKKLQENLIQSISQSYKHVEERLWDKENEMQVQKLLEKLPPQCKKVYLLFKIEGKSHREISDLLGISLSTVNNHITKANQLLKKHLYSDDLVFVYAFLAITFHKL